MFTILTIIHILFVCAALGSLLAYLWLFTWQHLDGFCATTLLALFVPSVCFGVTLCFAYFLNVQGIGNIYRGVATIVMMILCLIAIIVAAVLSIPKYREEDCEPNYAAFGIVCVYSIALATASTAVMF